MPSYFEFCCRAKTVAGHRVLEQLPELLSHLDAFRPMLVTDKGVSGAGLLDTLLDAAGSAMTVAAVEDDVPPDSDLKTVSRIADTYRRHRCDALIALGGGSVLDTAKGANILISEEADNLLPFSGAGNLKRPLKPLIAIPTTAGTGSEATLVAVIADHERHAKLPFTSYFLVPDVSLLDSRMTLSLPPAITAATAMDAITHAIEAYICLAHNPISDQFALGAVELISDHLVKVMDRPDDADGRLALAVGANMAGMAFSNAMVGMVHTLGHALGAVCGVPHGICMSVFLPYGLEFNKISCDGRIADLLLPLVGGREFAETPHFLRADRVVSHLRHLNQVLHESTNGRHPRFLNEIKGPDGAELVSVQQFDAIIEAAKGDGSWIYNPVELEPDDMRIILERAWDGRSLTTQPDINQG